MDFVAVIRCMFPIQEKIYGREYDCDSQPPSSVKKRVCVETSKSESQSIHFIDLLPEEELRILIVPP